MASKLDRKSSAFDVLWQDQNVQLLHHPRARSQAVANRNFYPGQSVFSDTALAIVLLPQEKGLRCDACFRCPGTLKRCSGCAEYWYCGKDCQSRHWKALHNHMCKNISRFRTIYNLQGSPRHEWTDAFLLSHLIAEHGHRFSGIKGLPSQDLNDPLATFTSLLPSSPDSHGNGPIICPMRHVERVSPEVLQALFNRFDKNNFIIHSHLKSVGHGIFPLASRLFNHSCIPNAIVAYVFLPEGMQMVVKALTDIKAGEEITIPYFDPALPFQRRQDICRYTYGFECDCPCCSFCGLLGNVPRPPTDPMQGPELDVLLKHAFPRVILAWPSHPLISTLPAELHFVLHEDFLPRLSKLFSDAAYDGAYSLALRSGVVLLALYLVVYPSRFPQIGVHCLEVAKTAWNASVANQRVLDKGEAELIATARQFLSLARDSLNVLGKEGDDDEGPLLECMTLEELLKSS